MSGDSRSRRMGVRIFVLALMVLVSVAGCRQAETPILTPDGTPAQAVTPTPTPRLDTPTPTATWTPSPSPYPSLVWPTPTETATAVPTPTATATMAATAEDDPGIAEAKVATDLLLATDDPALPQDNPIPMTWLREYDAFRAQDRSSKNANRTAQAVDRLLATYWQ